MIFGLAQTRESDRLVDALRRDGATTKKQLDIILGVARSAKPSGYDTHQQRVRSLYEGKLDALLAQELRRRYPRTHDRLPRVSIALARKIADEDATAYDQPPERWLTIRGERDDDDRRALDFAALVSGARMASAMREVERRLMLAKTVFLRVGFRPDVEGRGAVGGVGEVRLTPYWPSQVQVIPHHSAPDDLYSAVALLAETQGPQPGRWWELWRREVVEDDSGAPVSFGPWHAELVPDVDDKDRGDLRHARPLFGDGVYPLPTLPWVVLTDGMATGSVFLDEDRDIVQTVLSISSLLSTEMHKVDMSGHPQRWYSGNQTPVEELVGGPASVWQVGQGEQISQLPSDLTPHGRDLAVSITRYLAITRRQPGHAYDIEQAQVLSGVARKVERISADEARAERITGYRDVEEAVLLPIVVEVSDYWRGTSIGHAPRVAIDGAGQGRVLDDVAYHVDFAAPLTFDEPEAKERHARALLDSGVISAAKYAVLSGAYRNVEDAVQAGVVDELAGATAVPDGGGLEAMTASIGAVDDVQATALNGAQVASMMQIVQSVVRGELPRDSAVQMIARAFQMSVVDAEAIVGSAQPITVPAVVVENLS